MAEIEIERIDVLTTGNPASLILFSEAVSPYPKVPFDQAQ